MRSWTDDGSTDPKFVAKVEDIRRLHVDPPARAAVKFGYWMQTF